MRAAKYYSVILDCTPDINHMEQMSVILIPTQRMFKSLNTFLVFLNVSNSTTGEALQQKFIHFLVNDLNLSFEDCCGQSYDNGANMVGKYKGVYLK